MKHLKRKFLFSNPINKEVKEVLGKPINTKKFHSLDLKSFKNPVGFIRTDEDELIQGFFYKLKDNHYFIPEPNPIIIYFDVALQFSQRIKENYDKVLNELNAEKGYAYNVQNEFYVFFSNATICITFLFNSLEAFMNLMIPDNYEFKIPLDKKTEIYNKEQIQRNLGFEDKYKKIIPEIKGKAFHKTYGHHNDEIKKLKEFRDEIMHTKTFGSDGSKFYKRLFTMSLDFKYEKSLLAVKEYINYYQPGLIEDCDCGKSH